MGVGGGETEKNPGGDNHYHRNSHHSPGGMCFEPAGHIFHKRSTLYRNVGVAARTKKVNDDDVDDGYGEQCVERRLANTSASIDEFADEVARSPQQLPQGDWQ